MVVIAVAVFIAIAIAISISNSVAITVAIAHCHCNCPSPIAIAAAVGHCCGQCEPSLPPAATISVTSSSAIAVAVALAVGHCPFCHRRPSKIPLPLAITIAMPLVISKSCCLGAARIVFDQSKQRMLTLFYFV
jgi:hypothetical protein